MQTAVPASTTRTPTVEMTTPPQSGKRRQDIELARLISAFGVVWYHLEGSKSSIAYGGLVVFLALSLYFSGQPGSLWRKAQAKSRRLLLPWLVWSAVYGLAYQLAGKPIVSQAHSTLAVVLIGMAIHLWFLPFSFLAGLLFESVKPLLTPKRGALVGLGAAIATLLSSALWYPGALAAGAPWGQWAHAMPAVFIGTFLFCCRSLNRLWILTGFVVLLAAATLGAGNGGIGATYISRILMLAILVVGVLRPWIRFDVSGLSACAFGIYLVHPLLGGVIHLLFRVDGAALAVSAFSTSLAGVWAARRYFPSISRYCL